MWLILWETKWEIAKHKWGVFLVNMRILSKMLNTIEISIFWSRPSSSQLLQGMYIARIWSPRFRIQSFHRQAYFSPEDAEKRNSSSSPLVGLSKESLFLNTFAVHLERWGTDFVKFYFLKKSERVYDVKFLLFAHMASALESNCNCCLNQLYHHQFIPSPSPPFLSGGQRRGI